MFIRYLKIHLTLFLLVAGGCASEEQAHFQTPQAAADSLAQALRTNDTKRLNEIFGPDGKEIVASGDPVADQAQVARFLAAYDQHHSLDAQPDGVTDLLVGNDDWPFPVPIVKADGGGGYVFDTAAGKDEILNRRIGRNELATEQVCLAIVDAQRDYAQQRPMGGDVPQYAKKLISDPGTKNGLYWPTAEGEKPCPLGPLVAIASAEGYHARRDTKSPPPPYHGYYYRLLTSQGPHASGGQSDYIVDGRLFGGFGVVAYPAEYGNSGIATFMTNHDGVVFERDLGPDTAKIAGAMTQFDPGPGWTRTVVAPTAPAEP